MKTNFIQALHALTLPIIFILTLSFLNSIPLNSVDKYGFGSLFGLAIALVLSYIYFKVSKKTRKEAGFVFEKNTPKNFSKGFVIGFIIAAVMLAITIYFSGLKLTYIGDVDILWISIYLLAFLPLAFMEEIIFRGQAFIQMKEKVGIWPAQILFALLFAWYHDYTGLTLLNQLMGPGTWALIFGIGAIWTKGLAFPTGLHMAANVTLAIVGQKDDRHAIWIIDYASETSVLQSKISTVGIILQLCLLATGIILTEYYRRKKA